tara:strand:+ start:8082 stop:8261 length:180 start_codon:yes stop_codon:yes gene_type:complete
MKSDKKIYTLEKIRSDVLQFVSDKNECRDADIVKLYCIINDKYGYVDENKNAVIQERFR